MSIRYSERLAEADIEPSVGSVGDSYDNALAETINGLYKAEVIHRRSWRNSEQVELATLDWLHWLNHKRLLGPIGHNKPVRPRRPDSNQTASRKTGAVQRRPTLAEDLQTVARVTSRTPEVMVRISGKAKGAKHVEEHLRYITRDAIRAG